MNVKEQIMSMESTSHRRVPLDQVPGPSAQQLPARQSTVVRHVVNDQSLALPVNTGPVGAIAKATAGVMTKVGTIPKSGFNKFHNYHYVTKDDLLHATTPLMGEQGLALLQSEVEIQRVETRVAVLYDFTLMHESGETFCFRQTGMSSARDSKGNWDDKAINKCHTAARKYALAALFGVPSGDFDEDADADTNANQRTQQQPVPGPKLDQSRLDRGMAAADKIPRTQAQLQAQPSQEGVPHKLELPQGTTAEQWASAYIRNLGKAKTPEEISQWEELNDDFLQRINDRYPEIYRMIASAYQRRLSDVSGQPAGMPDPNLDPQEAMNWIAGQLQNLNTYQAAETFWNEIVAPREAEFEVVDWGMLMKEWYRTEMRLKPLDDDADVAGDPQ